jgi:threonine/homoserine/homoserine lactone efflux protein
MTSRTAFILAAWAATCTAWLLWVAWRYLRDRAEHAERSEAARREIHACLITLALRRARHDAAVKGWRTRRRMRRAIK